MADIPSNIPGAPAGAVPPVKKETGKVQPKKETVRINLPPKPSTAPTIKLPTLPPGGPTGAPSAAPLSTSAAKAPPAPAAAAPRAAARRCRARSSNTSRSGGSKSGACRRSHDWRARQHSGHRRGCGGIVCRRHGGLDVPDPQKCNRLKPVLTALFLVPKTIPFDVWLLH